MKKLTAVLLLVAVCTLASAEIRNPVMSTTSQEAAPSFDVAEVSIPEKLSVDYLLAVYQRPVMLNFLEKYKGIELDLTGGSMSITRKGILLRPRALKSKVKLDFRTGGLACRKKENCETALTFLKNTTQREFWTAINDALPDVPEKK